MIVKKPQHNNETSTADNALVNIKSGINKDIESHNIASCLRNCKLCQAQNRITLTTNSLLLAVSSEMVFRCKSLFLEVGSCSSM